MNVTSNWRSGMESFRSRLIRLASYESLGLYGFPVWFDPKRNNNREPDIDSLKPNKNLLESMEAPAGLIYSGLPTIKLGRLGSRVGRILLYGDTKIAREFSRLCREVFGAFKATPDAVHIQLGMFSGYSREKIQQMVWPSFAMNFCRMTETDPRLAGLLHYGTRDTWTHFDESDFVYNRPLDLLDASITLANWILRLPYNEPERPLAAGVEKDLRNACDEFRKFTNDVAQWPRKINYENIDDVWYPTDEVVYSVWNATAEICSVGCIYARDADFDSFHRVCRKLSSQIWHNTVGWYPEFQLDVERANTTIDLVLNKSTDQSESIYSLRVTDAARMLDLDPGQISRLCDSDRLKFIGSGANRRIAPAAVRALQVELKQRGKEETHEEVEAKLRKAGCRP